MSEALFKPSTSYFQSVLRVELEMARDADTRKHNVPQLVLNLTDIGTTDRFFKLHCLVFERSENTRPISFMTTNTRSEFSAASRTASP